MFVVSVMVFVVDDDDGGDEGGHDDHDDHDILSGAAVRGNYTAQKRIEGSWEGCEVAKTNCRTVIIVVHIFDWEQCDPTQN